MEEQALNLRDFLLIAGDPLSGHDERNFDAINGILDKIIAWEYSAKERLEPFSLESQVVQDFVMSGTQMLSSASVLLCSKFGQAIGLLIQNWKISLMEECVHISINFFLSTLGKCKSSLSLELLNILQIVVKAYSKNLIEETLDHLFGLPSNLWSCLYQGNTDIAQQKACLDVVIAALPVFEDSTQSKRCYLKVIFSQIVHHLRIMINIITSEDLNICKMVLNALQAFQTILGHVKERDDVLEPEIIIALLKVFLPYGLPGYQSKLDFMRRNLPAARGVTETSFINEEDIVARKEKSALSKKMVSSAKVKKKKSRNKNKKRDSSLTHSSDNVETPLGEFGTTSGLYEYDLSMFSLGRSYASFSSSESDLSDVEVDESIGFVSCKVRLTTLRCMQGLLKSTTAPLGLCKGLRALRRTNPKGSEKRVKFSCWLLLVPENKSDLDASLLATLEEDNSPKVRTAAFNTLLELMDGSKMFLDMAMAKSVSQPSTLMSFVSYSTKLRQSVELLHSAIAKQINKEPKLSLREKAVKCLTLLILNCPYDKLGNQWLRDLVPVLSNDLKATDPGLLVSAMTALAAIVSIRERTGDIRELFQHPATPLLIEIAKGFGNNASNLETFSNAWLAYFSYKLVETCDKDDQVSERFLCEGLQVLTVILRTYPELVNDHCRQSTIRLILGRLPTFSSVTLAFDAVKLLEEMGKYFARLASSVDGNRSSDVLNEAIAFWEEVTPGPVISMLQSPVWTVKVKAAVCDWIATIGPDLFPLLKYHHQIMCKTLLLGTAQDGDDQIKAAAVRALGVVVTYPCMKEDPAFVVDTGDVLIQHLSSSNVTLQIKAAWAIGNLCDSCLKNRLLSPGVASDGLPKAFIHKLLTTSAKVSRDNDKVKSNGVRAVGNLIRSLPRSMLDESNFQEAIEDGVMAVTSNILSGPMKGRWNACYACCNIFCNEDIEIQHCLWQEPMFKALLSALKDCKNYKVRIGATSAFRSLKSRNQFASSDRFVGVWRGTMEALATSEDMTDLKEVKYKDFLQTQICGLLCHLINLASLSDLEEIQMLSTEQYSLLTGHLYRHFGSMRLPAGVGSASSDDTSVLGSYKEKLVEWEAFKGSLQRVTMCQEMKALVDKIGILFA